jgi:hypothetical protein
MISLYIYKQTWVPVFEHPVDLDQPPFERSEPQNSRVESQRGRYDRELGLLRVIEFVKIHVIQERALEVPQLHRGTGWAKHLQLDVFLIHCSITSPTGSELILQSNPFHVLLSSRRNNRVIGFYLDGIPLGLTGIIPISHQIINLLLCELNGGSRSLPQEDCIDTIDAHDP